MSVLCNVTKGALEVHAYVLIVLGKQWCNTNVAKKSDETAEKLIRIANKNGWKHEL